jgi:PadR family transcriptional regulator, regulatory protein PadR
VRRVSERVIRKLFLGFMQIHILHHAKKEPFFGSWMIEELQEHGYQISPGTLYPILHNLETEGLLEKEERIVDAKIRKYYKITEKGEEVLVEARKKAYELFREIKD